MNVERIFEQAPAKLPCGTARDVAQASQVARSTVMRRLRNGDAKAWKVAVKIGTMKREERARAERLAERALALR